MSPKLVFKPFGVPDAHSKMYDKSPGVSFQLDCYNHAIFAVRQWPRRTFPGIITALTGMGFQEYAITMNVYPKRVPLFESRKIMSSSNY